MSDEPRRRGEDVLVVKRRQGLPYSKGLMAQSMTAAGLPPARAYELARIVGRRLGDRGGTEVAVEELRRLAEAVLTDEEGERAVARYRSWQHLHDAERPLIVLIGGATGTGKSTLASLLAHRLGINRVVATDMIRQVLRSCFDQRIMPAVHVSSFEVGDGVRLRAPTGEDDDIAGFLRQVEHVSVGVGALVERAIAERAAMIVEGVHLVPGLLAGHADSARIVSVVLAVDDEARHRAHLARRGGGTQRRPAERYLRRVATIRKLQGYLIQRAHEDHVPVLDNVDVDGALEELGEIVLAALDAPDERPRAASAV